MVDNLGHWEMTCPFIKGEPTFGDTLVDFARRHQVTSLFVCNDDQQNSEVVLQRSVIDNADCLIQFRRIAFRGGYKVILRIVKTRGMKHRRESFELHVGPRSVEVDTRASLLRINSSGDVEPLKIRLFLHYESAMQKRYHRDWVDRLQSVLSSDIVIDPHDSSAFLQGMKWANSSSIDELQLCQIDEFQLPHARDVSSAASLHEFKKNEWREDWNEVLPRLQERCKTSQGSFFAIPFFENVSLLAYRLKYTDSDGLEQIPAVSNWSDLAEQCHQWDTLSKESDSLFFDFAGTTEENYNCMFLEILLSLAKPQAARGRCNLVAWLTSDEASKACLLYRKLCRRAHLMKSGESYSESERNDSDDRSVRLSDKAIVWRLWYSSANQLLARMSSNERDQIAMGPLPGNVTIAGEWYLAMPAYSSAHEIGLQIIDSLTDRHAELTRLRGGIGLPTRSEFYGSETGDKLEAIKVSPYFSMNLQLLKSLVDHAFVRSSFTCYSQISSILASHLMMILELPDANCEKDIEKGVSVILRSLESQINFAMPNLGCNSCQALVPKRK